MAAPTGTRASSSSPSISSWRRCSIWFPSRRRRPAARHERAADRCGCRDAKAGGSVAIDALLAALRLHGAGVAAGAAAAPISDSLAGPEHRVPERGSGLVDRGSVSDVALGVLDRLGVGAGPEGCARRGASAGVTVLRTLEDRRGRV